MSNTKTESSSYAFSAIKSNKGAVDIPNTRLYELDCLLPADKVISAIVDFELQGHDMDLVTCKLQRLEKLAKTGNKEAKKDIEVLTVYKEHFENFGNASRAPVNEGDEQYIHDLRLLTVKPVIYVYNVDDASAVLGNAYVEKVKTALPEDTKVLMIAGEREQSSIFADLRFTLKSL